MSTEAQIAANRINAQLSTGPRTIEGKARTSQNALSSGLFSKRDFVRPEEAAEYTEIRDTLWADLHPPPYRRAPLESRKGNPPDFPVQVSCRAFSITYP